MAALVTMALVVVLAQAAIADTPENQLPGGNPATMITVTPDSGLRAGQEVHITGTGFNLGVTFGAPVRLCTTAATPVCSEPIGEFGTFNGNANTFVRVPPRFDPAGPAAEVNCRLVQCVILLDDGLHRASHLISFSSFRLPGDFNDDGMAEITVFRNGVWFIRGGNPSTVVWGTAGDKPVPHDYDGDGDSEIAVFRPTTGVWFIRGGPTVQFGTAGDIPVPADYDGNGTADIAVFRPSTGVWFVRGGEVVQFGTNGDIPVPGDYEENADGRFNMAVFRPSTGVWFIRDGNPATVAFGAPGDIPVPNSYDIDADTDIAVFRPSSGVWFFHIISDPIAWGTAGDVPVPRANPSL